LLLISLLPILETYVFLFLFLFYFFIFWSFQQQHKIDYLM
jgi:hypothetical protein